MIDNSLNRVQESFGIKPGRSDAQSRVPGLSLRFGRAWVGWLPVVSQHQRCTIVGRVGLTVPKPTATFGVPVEAEAGGAGLAEHDRFSESTSMRTPRRLVGAVIVILVWTSVAVAGPTALPSNIIRADAPLTGEQRQIVEQFVQSYMDQLVRLDSTDFEVAQAQRHLSDPMRNPNASALFIEMYVPRVANQLPKALNSSSRPIVRLNAMIVAASLAEGFSVVTEPPTILGTSGLVRVIEIGLTDPDAYVRYWAAKAVGRRKTYQAIDEADQRKLLAALRTAAGHETWALALQQDFLGMNKLTIAEADDAVLNVLDQRVAIIAATPDQSLVGDYEGMYQLFRKMVQAQDNPHTQQVNQRSARVLYFYLSVLADSLGRGTLSQENVETCKQVILLADQWLPHFCQAGPPPGLLKSSVEKEDWSALQRQVQQWPAPLKKTFGFTDADLQIPTSAFDSN